MSVFETLLGSLFTEWGLSPGYRRDGYTPEAALDWISLSMAAPEWFHNGNNSYISGLNMTAYSANYTAYLKAYYENTGSAIPVGQFIYRFVDYAGYDQLLY